jgi:autotransporter translocation and assembly factor TamB
LAYAVGPDQIAIQNLSLKLYEGALAGQATLPRMGEDSARLDIQFEPALNLHALAEDASGRELPLFGQIAGKITAQAPRTQVADLAAWVAGLNLSIENGTAGGLEIQRAGLQMMLQEGVVSLAKTGLTWANSTLDVSGQLALAEPQAFQAEVELKADDLRELNQLSGEIQLPTTIAGSLEARGEVKGQWKNLTWQASGSAASQNLTIDKVLVDSINLEGAATPEQIKLNRFDLAVYEGQLKGRGEFPLTPRGAGEFQFDWDKINVGSVAQVYLDPPTTITGIMSGQAKATLEKPPAERGPREWSIQAGFQIPKITMGDVEAGDLKGNLGLKDQSWHYQVQGKLFEGDLNIQGELPKESPPESSTRIPPGQGQIKLSKLQLQ